VFLFYFRFLFCEFLYLRGWNLFFPTNSFSLFSMNFSVLDFTFIKLKDSIVYCLFSKDYMRTYKLRLKLLIKNYYFNFSNIYFLKQINKLIFYWSISYNYINCLFDVWSNLDVYLYKLLWYSVRRRHPRRPNTWIYSKYWRFFSGFYRFFFLNSITGGFCVLRSHFYLDIYLCRVPLSSSFYSFFDKKKITFFAFNRFKYSFLGLFKYFWFKQRGLCYICHRIFDSVDFNAIKIFNMNHMTNNLSSYSLVHSYCCI
jgi:hypothetical protein